MLKIKNKIEFENNLWIGEIDATNFNSSDKERIKTVTDIASVTKGRLGFEGSENNRLKLYDRLLTESGGKPSVPFEFIPIVSSQYANVYKTHHTIFKYGIVKGGLLHTNYRNILHNSSYVQSTSENYNHLNRHFKIIIGKIPIKVLTHLRTHRAFSFLVESSRNKKYLNEVEFWYSNRNTPTLNNLLKEADELNLQSLQNLTEEYEDYKSEDATMELSDRRLVLFAMAAWKQDENSWNNLFAVRGDKTGTMNITGQVVNNIKTLINDR